MLRRGPGTGNSPRGAWAGGSQYGDEEDGELLQMVFSEHVVPHESTVQAAGLCDEACFDVLCQQMNNQAANEAQFDVLQAAAEARFVVLQATAEAGAGEQLKTLSLEQQRRVIASLWENGDMLQMVHEAAAFPFPGRLFQLPFPPRKVGTFSNHGIEPHSAYQEGVPNVLQGFTSTTNQDRGSVAYPFLGSYKRALFCVMGGHGSHGHKVSEYCIQQLHDYLHESKLDVLADPLKAFTTAYETVDKTLLDSQVIGTKSQTSGTSAVAVYVNGKTLYTANVGSDRAVIATREPDGSLKASDLSVDLCPDSVGEYERIIAAAGKLLHMCRQFLFNQNRLYAPCYI